MKLLSKLPVRDMPVVITDDMSGHMFREYPTEVAPLSDPAVAKPPPLPPTADADKARPEGFDVSKKAIVPPTSIPTADATDDLRKPKVTRTKTVIPGTDEMERVLFRDTRERVLPDDSRKQVYTFTNATKWRFELSGWIQELVDFREASRGKAASGKRIRFDDWTPGQRDRAQAITKHLRSLSIKLEHAAVDIVNTVPMSVSSAIAVAAVCDLDIAFRRGHSVQIVPRTWRTLEEAKGVSAADTDDEGEGGEEGDEGEGDRKVLVFVLDADADVERPKTYMVRCETATVAQLEERHIVVKSIDMKIMPVRLYKVADLNRILDIIGHTADDVRAHCGKARVTKNDTYEFIMEHL
jgi:hypothetical protein